MEAENGIRELAPCLEHHVQPDRLTLLDVVHPLAGLVLEPRVDEPGVDVGHAPVERASVGGLGTPEVEPVVAQRRLLGIPDVAQLAVVDQHRAIAQRLDRRHVVCHEHECLAGPALLVKHIHALLGEGGVSDGQHLVDEHDVGVGLDHHREGEAHHHP